MLLCGTLLALLLFVAMLDVKLARQLHSAVAQGTDDLEVDREIDRVLSHPVSGPMTAEHS